jgi:hypothetical protein
VVAESWQSAWKSGIGLSPGTLVMGERHNASNPFHDLAFAGAKPGASWITSSCWALNQPDCFDVLRHRQEAVGKHGTREFIGPEVLEHATLGTPAP